ncbi:rRNA maturation RNase YbeY [Ferrovibrio sp.]|uniref:rRNA maturation RNase YbeY n=1 Tax=Ferrovibrio sp. TaxID=1917215 RepID=UPI0039C86CCC
MSIDIRIAAGPAAAAWRKALPNPAATLRKAVRAALRAELPGTAETALSILLTDDAEMQKLNAGWRARDKPTNVLSFPAEAVIDPARPPAYLGDIALGLTTCRTEAKEQGKRFADHLVHLTVHGVLHLIGYDHMTGAEAAAMEPREVEILRGLGIADPYRLPVRKKTTKKAVKKTVKKTIAGKKAAAARRRAA